eukprot:gene6255-2882_t
MALQLNGTRHLNLDGRVAQLATSWDEVLPPPAEDCSERGAGSSSTSRYTAVLSRAVGFLDKHDTVELLLHRAALVADLGPS